MHLGERRGARAPDPNEPPAMKKVEAVIRPFKVDEVKLAQTALGIGGMTVTEARGVGHEPERTDTYCEARYTIDLPPKTKIEVALPDYLADCVVHSSHRATMRLACGLILGVGGGAFDTLQHAVDGQRPG